MNKEILNFDEYSHTLEAKDSLGNYTQVFNNYFNFVFSPETAEWAVAAQDLLHTQYNCVILNNTFYFKTESDRTMFLLRFS
jgi:hypothetical protein